jgi:hypothetical protein
MNPAPWPIIGKAQRIMCKTLTFRDADVADNGVQRQEFLLDRADLGLHLPPMVWDIQYKCSADAVLFVFASHPYDPDD